MHIIIKSPIASIIGNIIHKKLSDSDDSAVNVIGVKKIATPTPVTVIATKKNQIPPNNISSIAKISEIIIRKNIPFENMNIIIRFIIASQNERENPISKISSVPLSAINK